MTCPTCGFQGLDPAAAGPCPRCRALAILQTVKEALRAEYEAHGKGAVFDALSEALTGQLPGTYAEAGARLGLSEGAVKVAVHRLRRRFADALRAHGALS